MVSENHPPYSFFNDTLFPFMDQLFIHLQQLRTDKALKEMLKSHPQIWKNENYRKSAILGLVHIGTNMLVQEVIEERVLYNTWPLSVAQSIVVLEQYNNARIRMISTQS